MLVVISLLVATFTAFWFYVKHKHSFWERQGVKGPKPLFLFGNTLEHFRENQHFYEAECAQKYGKVWGTYNFLAPVLNVADADAFYKIMVKDFKYFPQRFPDGTQAHHLTKLFLTVVNGDEWKMLREAMSPAFSPSKMRKMVELMKSCVKSMDTSLVNAVKGVAKSTSQVDTMDNQKKEGVDIEARSLYGKYSLDVISKCCFATDTQCHDVPNNIFFHHANRLFQMKFYHLAQMVFYPKWFKNLTQFTTVNKTSLEFFKKVSRELIYRRRDQPNPERNDDFLQSMIDAQKGDPNYNLNESNADLGVYIGGGSSKGTKDGDEDSKKKETKGTGKFKFSDDHVISNSIIFFGAGYETTASLLAFASYALAMHQDVQERLYQEILDTIEAKGGSGRKDLLDALDYATLNDMEYLDQFVNETLRLYSPIPRMPRVTHGDYVLKLDNIGGRKLEVKLPSGIHLNLAFAAVNQDPEYWENPDKFDPERFSKEKKGNIKSFSYLPFGAGPRYCIGMRFALLEAKLSLVTQIAKFKFLKSPLTDEKLEFSPNMFLLQTEKMIIRLVEREQ